MHSPIRFKRMGASGLFFSSLTLFAALFKKAVKNLFRNKSEKSFSHDLLVA
jgi:integral membrane sensor domain MASE1